MAGRRGHLLVFFISLLLAGCKSNCQAVENELRARDNQYREALEELGRAEQRGDALQRELETIRKGGTLTPEMAAQGFGLRRIVLGRATGGLDNDRLPGDEMLQVVVEPRDSSDHTVKAPGTLQITALEINFQGGKVPIGEWDINSDELRQSWKQTLLSTGYNLRLPFKTLPGSEEIRIVARFKLADGRVYEADKDIRVRITPGRPPRVVPEQLPPPEGPKEIGPTLLPASRNEIVTNRSEPASHWEPAPLHRSVELGRPAPFAPQIIIPEEP